MLTAHPAANPPDPQAPSPSRQDLHLPVLTLAGARVDRIPTGVASTFVARLPDAAWTGDIDLAVGAVTDSGELVGTALLSPPHAEWADALVAVTPARRRLGLGADLLLVLVDGAANRALRGIACALETDTTAAQRLCRTLGLEPRIVRSPQDVDVIEILIRPRPTRPGKPALDRDGDRPARGGPLTRPVRQTGPEVELAGHLAGHLGHEPHRRGAGTMSSVRACAGEDLVVLAGSDQGDVEPVAEDVDHTRGGAGEAEGGRRLPSAIPPAGLVLGAALAQLAQCGAAHRAERPGA